MARQSFLTELMGVIVQRKKLWLIPLVIVMLIVGIMVLLGGSPGASIYPVF